MKNGKKLLAIIVIMQLLCCTNLNIFALEKEIVSSEVTQIIDNSNVFHSELPQFIKQNVNLNEKEILAIESKGAEDLNSFITINNDGTKTQYTYDTPIKYIENNTVRFKETTLEKRDLTKRIFSKYEYENTKNNIKSYYPKDINDGILTEYLDYSVNLKPKSSALKEAKEISVDSKKNTTKYLNVFSENEYVVYFAVSY